MHIADVGDVIQSQRPPEDRVALQRPGPSLSTDDGDLLPSVLHIAWTFRADKQQRKGSSALHGSWSTQ
nr:hypothetical protein Iba_chr05dCG13510 [Ipomoea batatas]